MNGRAYYNENDAAAGAILRELIARNVITPGDVDDRSIKDVQPSDLAGYTQCHFFAGGGLWSVAARLAGWPDDRPLWTGSCPCQPFSAAGKGHGTDDPRHLWPDFHRLIRARRPTVVMGEQVAGAAGYGWFDGVRADLESENYTGRAVDIPACSIDAPHQRNRLYWIARLQSDAGCELRWPGPGIAKNRKIHSNHYGFLQSDPNRGGCSGRPEDAEWVSEERAVIERAATGLQPNSDESELQGQSSARQQPLAQSDASPLRNNDGMHLPDDVRLSEPGRRRCGSLQHALSDPQQHSRAVSGLPSPRRNGSWWAEAEWLISPLDGKARRANPGIPFLVNGLPGRVDLWRVGGNAIVPVLAAEVIASFLDAEAIGDVT